MLLENVLSYSSLLIFEPIIALQLKLVTIFFPIFEVSTTKYKISIFWPRVVTICGLYFCYPIDYQETNSFFCSWRSESPSHLADKVLFIVGCSMTNDCPHFFFAILIFSDKSIFLSKYIVLYALSRPIDYLTFKFTF